MNDQQRTEWMSIKWAVEMQIARMKTRRDVRRKLGSSLAPSRKRTRASESFTVDRWRHCLSNPTCKIVEVWKEINACSTCQRKKLAVTESTVARFTTRNKVASQPCLGSTVIKKIYRYFYHRKFSLFVFSLTTYECLNIYSTWNIYKFQNFWEVHNSTVNLIFLHCFFAVRLWK